MSSNLCSGCLISWSLFITILGDIVADKIETSSALKSLKRTKPIKCRRVEANEPGTSVPKWKKSLVVQSKETSKKELNEDELEMSKSLEKKHQFTTFDKSFSWSEHFKSFMLAQDSKKRRFSLFSWEFYLFYKMEEATLFHFKVVLNVIKALQYPECTYTAAAI